MKKRGIATTDSVFAKSAPDLLESHFLYLHEGSGISLEVIKERGFLGEVAGHKTIKLKVGYKKSTAKKPAKKKPRRRANNIF